ncbi:hypothetical protein BgiMline_019131 [Biomphalaria glabrata]|nr:hypothetical protein BgiMline_006714 [Biomphalaria glabrata]
MSWWRHSGWKYSHYPKPYGPYYYYHLSRHCRRGSMFGRLFFFLVGVYTGVVANQRYRIPEAPTPCCGRRRTSSESDKDTKSKLDDFPEIKEAIEKLKSLEKRYRKNPTNEDGPENPPTPPTSS